MKTKTLSFFKVSVLAILTVAMAFTIFSCGKEDVIANGTEITLTIAVTNKAGETTEQEIKTTAENLGDALVDAGIAEGTTDQYGLFITSVNGEVADYSVDGAYWALSKEGEYLMTGASQTPIADGEHYELVYTVYSE